MERPRPSGPALRPNQRRALVQAAGNQKRGGAGSRGQPGKQASGGPVARADNSTAHKLKLCAAQARLGRVNRVPQGALFRCPGGRLTVRRTESPEGWQMQARRRSILRGLPGN